MQSTTAQVSISPADITVQDINGLTITAKILPSDFIASEQAFMDNDDSIVATEIQNQATFTQAIIDRQNEIDNYQALTIASQTKIDAANADKAAHQANVDAVIKVLPILTPAP